MFERDLFHLVGESSVTVLLHQSVPVFILSECLNLKKMPGIVVSQYTALITPVK